MEATFDQQEQDLDEMKISKTYMNFIQDTSEIKKKMIAFLATNSAIVTKEYIEMKEKRVTESQNQKREWLSKGSKDQDNMTLMLKKIPHVAEYLELQTTYETLKELLQLVMTSTDGPDESFNPDQKGDEQVMSKAKLPSAYIANDAGDTLIYDDNNRQDEDVPPPDQDGSCALLEQSLAIMEPFPVKAAELDVGSLNNMENLDDSNPVPITETEIVGETLNPNGTERDEVENVFQPSGRPANMIISPGKNFSTFQTSSLSYQNSPTFRSPSISRAGSSMKPANFTQRLLSSPLQLKRSAPLSPLVLPKGHYRLDTHPKPPKQIKLAFGLAAQKSLPQPDTEIKNSSPVRYIRKSSLPPSFPTSPEVDQHPHSSIESPPSTGEDKMDYSCFSESYGSLKQTVSSDLSNFPTFPPEKNDCFPSWMGSTEPFEESFDMSAKKLPSAADFFKNQSFNE